ncbi:unnamed protein product [Paramecium octaurelia]|uniref:Uncharacterized protein n=1 Tax=Paramecium octaurelia TaxID=43137 RepID=A0A8S1S7Q7_PAROT|nr:unnamed protein product [Paramecium octaurelia]
MINEAKFELLKQIDYWTQDLQKYQKQHDKEIELFYLERLAITNMNIQNMEQIIRKYELLKMVYQEITKNHSQKYSDDTFNTLYNKYCNEKKSKQSATQSQKKSVNNCSTVQNKGRRSNQNNNVNTTKEQKITNQQSTIEPNQIIDEYIDEIDYYADKVTHLQHQIEQHSHEELLSQLQQLQLEQEGLQSDYNAIIEENERLKTEIQDNQQRVNELRELQLQLIDEFKQFN